VESSSPNNPDKKADYTTCKLGLNYLTDPELTFWYHMFSDNSGQDEMGDLYLDICVDGTWKNDVVHLSGNKGDSWFEQTVDLNDHKGERVILRFRAVTGSVWASDICIDDFRIEGETASDNIASKSPLSFDLKFYGSRIYFHIPDSKDKKKHLVKIRIYNMQGKIIKTLLNKKVASGPHYINLGIYGNREYKLAAGLYFCRMKVGSFNKTINIVLKK
jgi:hypothetical protein